MNALRDKLLDIFESNTEEFFSGEELAGKLNVSRSAIWKAIKKLEDDGYCFEAVRGKGYRLSGDNDVLSEGKIMEYLGEAGNRLNLKVYKTISSTNTVLKGMAAEGAPEGTILVAGEQTAGRGRMNRSFFSPTDTGLYMSILLRPKMKVEESLFITTAAAVATARAIEELFSKKVGIKWVNDVFIGDKKVCGILTEASLNMEGGEMEYAVSGIGINVSTPQGGFPEGINATSIFEDEPKPANARNMIAAEIIRNFMQYYDCLPQHTFLDEYVSRSIIIGKDIVVMGNGETRPARALSIDEKCRLLVRYKDGGEEFLSSGEVSIRPA